MSIDSFFIHNEASIKSFYRREAQVREVIMVFEAWVHLDFWGHMIPLTPFLLLPFSLIALFVPKRIWSNLFVGLSCLPLLLGLISWASGFGRIRETVGMMGFFPAEAVDFGTQEARLPLIMGLSITLFFLVLALFAELSARRAHRSELPTASMLGGVAFSFFVCSACLTGEYTMLAWGRSDFAVWLGLASVFPGSIGLLSLLILVFKKWRKIQGPHSRMTPGKAVGLLFVPIFNVYWIFQVFWGFSKDYNAWATQTNSSARRLPIGWFLVHAVLVFFLCAPVLGLFAAPLFAVGLIMTCGAVNTTPPAPRADETRPGSKFALPLVSLCAIVSTVAAGAIALGRQPISPEDVRALQGAMQTEDESQIEAEHLPPPAQKEKVAIPDPTPDEDMEISNVELLEPTTLNGLGIPDPSASEEAVAIVGVEGVEAPVFTKKVSPAYPELAQKARIQGTVILEAILRKDGRITDLKILRGLGGGKFGLEQAARDAVQQWEFTPGKRSGEPADVRMTLAVHFTLQ